MERNICDILSPVTCNFGDAGRGKNLYYFHDQDLYRHNVGQTTRIHLSILNLIATTVEKNSPMITLLPTCAYLNVYHITAFVANSSFNDAKHILCGTTVKIVWHWRCDILANVIALPFISYVIKTSSWIYWLKWYIICQIGGAGWRKPGHHWFR